MGRPELRGPQLIGLAQLEEDQSGCRLEPDQRSRAPRVYVLPEHNGRQPGAEVLYKDLLTLHLSYPRWRRRAFPDPDGVERGA